MIALFVRGNDANTELLRYLANSELCIGFSSNEKSSDIFSIIPQSSIDNFLKRLIVLRLSYKAYLSLVVTKRDFLTSKL